MSVIIAQIKMFSLLQQKQIRKIHLYNYLHCTWYCGVKSLGFSPTLYKSQLSLENVTEVNFRIRETNFSMLAWALLI